MATTKMLLRCALILLVAGCVLRARSSSAADDGPRNLVAASWLQQHLDDRDLVLLDASPRAMFNARHIPGATSVDLMSWYGIREASVVEMERLYQSWGVSAGKKIVMYDEGGTFLATRLFYQLYYHGFPLADLFVLDGGLAKWQQMGLPVTKDTSLRAAGTFKVTTIKEDVRVRLPEVVAASGDPTRTALVEGLGPDWHFGETAPFDRAGHIPNGILMPSADFFNADKTFKSPDEIRRMLNYLGIKPDQQVYSYCGGGVAASVPFFAIKFMANYPNVKLFKESEMGWLADERRLPYWTYDAPTLLRESGWVQFWAGDRVRMFGGGQVSLVDVRAASAYGDGHLPFAINVPAEVFRHNLRDPKALADLLGPAGIDVSHEAIVVSGGGLTPDAALAFVMLEKLGQKNVSMFTDSIEAWSARGLPTKKTATVVGPRTATQPLAIPPSTYPHDVRADVIVADARSTRGVYPKVFIASGKTAPSHVPDGTVVHVPYSELLTADGTPKPAKDLWSLLSKAGVPRYAELVPFSDDPGDAAVTYFVLKLMGYPDVKLLVP